MYIDFREIENTGNSIPKNVKPNYICHLFDYSYIQQCMSWTIPVFSPE